MVLVRVIPHLDHRQVVVSGNAGGCVLSWEATAGDVLSIPLMRAQIRAYQAKERMVQAMDEQPLTDCCVTRRRVSAVPLSRPPKPHGLWANSPDPTSPNLGTRSRWFRRQP
jgi:hypothetical protein